MRPKRELVRIVRTPEGHVAVDETGKEGGRGAYLCPKPSCWERALSKSQLNRALRTNVTEEARARLLEYAADLRPEIGACNEGSR